MDGCAMVTDTNRKRLDDEDAAGWWNGLFEWLTRIQKPDYFWGRRATS